MHFFSFIRFIITPSHDINFGSIIAGNKKSRQFTIENKGGYDFKYLIQKYVVKPIDQQRPQLQTAPSPGGPPPPPTAVGKTK